MVKKEKHCCFLSHPQILNSKIPGEKNLESKIFWKSTKISFFRCWGLFVNTSCILDITLVNPKTCSQFQFSILDILLQYIDTTKGLD